MSDAEILNRIKALESKLEFMQVTLVHLKTLNDQVSKLQTVINNIANSSIVNLSNNIKQIQNFINNELPQKITQAMNTIRSL